jgi:hypothetical protein
MVVQVLVAHRQRADTLPKQLLNAVLDQLRIASVAESSGQTADRPGPQLQFPEQQSARFDYVMLR